MSENKTNSTDQVEHLEDKAKHTAKTNKTPKSVFLWVKKHIVFIGVILLIGIAIIVASLMLINQGANNNRSGDKNKDEAAKRLAEEDERLLNMKPESLGDKVLALAYSGDSEGAAKMIDAEIEKATNPKDKARMYAIKSSSLLAQEKYAEAIENSNIAMEMDEDKRPGLVLYQANIYARMGDIASGIRIIDEEISRLSEKEDSISKSYINDLQTKKGVIQNEN